MIQPEETREVRHSPLLLRVCLCVVLENKGLLITTLQCVLQCLSGEWTLTLILVASLGAT